MIELILVTLAAVLLLGCGWHLAYMAADIHGDRLLAILGVTAGLLTSLIGVAVLVLAWRGT